MIVINSKKKLTEYLSHNAKKYAFIPTMGNLHAGHISLIHTAKKYSKHIIVSIFVNPTQFSATEDFSTYPRTQKVDIQLLEQENIDIAYIPAMEDIFPTPSTIWLDIPHLTNILCGKSRPHFFNGVMTVLLKLFFQINPYFVILGEKDYQQYLIVHEMVASIGIDTQVISSPIIRNQNGLALSSRNIKLHNVKQAEEINKILFEYAKTITTKEDLESCKNKLLIVVDELDYLEIRHKSDLTKFQNNVNLKDYRLFFAGKINGVRLIDNIAL